MADAFRLWFIVLYALGLTGFLASVVRFLARRPTIEQRIGPIPPAPAVLSWLVALGVLLTRVGQVQAEWLPLRVLGVLLSLYALVMVPWAIRVLGRHFVPGAAVLRDHAVVTSGPYRLVRHPIYSAVVALWLGAALGTLDWLLLALWPLIVFAILKHVKAEEGLLRAKFGDAYEAYSKGKGRLVPRL